MNKEWSTLKRLIWLMATALGSGVKTVSGAVVSFVTEAAAALEGLVVHIEPAQDLNGYDSPWPGGGRANQYDATSNPVEIGGLQSADGSENTSSTRIRTSGYIPVKPGQPIVASWTPSGGVTSLQFYWYFYGSDKSYVGNGGSWMTLANNETTLPSNCHYVRCLWRITGQASATMTTDMIEDVQLEYAAEATEYVPYSNICPISGWTEANVWVEATHDTSANPTVTVDLDGTRYGGTLDVLTGKLLADRVFYELDGTEETWTALPADGATKYYRCKVSSDRYYLSTDLSKAACSHYPTADISSSTTDVGFGVLNSSTTAIRSALAFRPDLSVIDTLDKWKQFLADEYAANHPVQCVVGLTEPVEVQLTAEQVDALLGQNYVWSDAGDVTVKYTKG